MKKMIVFSAIGFLLLAAATGFAKRGPIDLPDLVVSKVNFQEVKSGDDSGGNTYWIFNVIVSVKNQGKEKAGAFQVLLERKNGAGGSFQNACATCTFSVAGLAAGQELTLDPRQFNNANGAPSMFRARVDSGNAVNESNELNNAKEEKFVGSSVSGRGPKPALALPDMTVTSLDFQNMTTSTARGKTYVHFDLVATVKNQGPGKSMACIFQFDYSADPKGYFTPIGADIPVSALAAGAQIVLTRTGAVYEVGSNAKYYRADVDPYHVNTEGGPGPTQLVKVLPGY